MPTNSTVCPGRTQGGKSTAKNKNAFQSQILVTLGSRRKERKKEGNSSSVAVNRVHSFPLPLDFSVDLLHYLSRSVSARLRSLTHSLISAKKNFLYAYQETLREEKEEEERQREQEHENMTSLNINWAMVSVPFYSI